jgi:putative flippase GtrA
MTHLVKVDSVSNQKTSWLHQFAFFIGVGAICATIDVGIMHTLLELGNSLWLATSAGFLAGLLLNFIAHARMTFQAQINWRRWWRFLLVVGLNYLMTLACVGLLTYWLDNPMAGKLLSLPLVAVNGFVLSRRWIFK